MSKQVVMTNTAEVITVGPDGEVSDEVIVQRVVDGDTEQFRILYERYANRVWRFSIRMTGNVEAEDLTSEIFLRVYRNLGRFRGESSFSTWFYRVMVSVAINFKSRQRNQSFPGKQEPLLQVIAKPSEDNPEAAACKKELQTHVQRAMSGLTPKARAVVVLSVEGFDYAEIADLMRIRQGTVGSTLTRARGELARKLNRLKGSN